jgi:predicted RNA binding protein YcfA (HicA-like mRNA interferase family)
MMRTVKSKDLIKEFTRDGWFLHRVNGSHHIYKHPRKTGHISIPHPKSDLGVGLIAKLREFAAIQESS